MHDKAFKSWLRLYVGSTPDDDLRNAFAAVAVAGLLGHVAGQSIGQRETDSRSVVYAAEWLAFRLYMSTNGRADASQRLTWDILWSAAYA